VIGGRSLRTSTILAIAAMTLGVAIAREASIGAEAVAAADAAMARSDWPEAIDRSRAAAQAIAPFSRWPDRGASRLLQIGADAEGRGDSPTALLAYGALRSAAVSISGFDGRSARWRDQAADGLTRVARTQSGAGQPRSSEADGAVPLDFRGADGASAWSLAAIALAGVSAIAGVVVIAMPTRRLDVRLGQALVAVGVLVYAIQLLLN
jgi:hypothetical protein